MNFDRGEIPAKHWQKPNATFLNISNENYINMRRNRVSQNTTSISFMHAGVML